ncbi:MAG: transcriptional regulator, partial [Paucibacter sp.]|nr:transcriptional regulator [Roseateles sp.]
MAALTRALWLKGNREQAEEMAWQTITEAQQLDHPISYCIALIYAGPIFIWNGDWDTAEALIEQLITHAGKHMLGPYQAVGQGLKGQLLVARGQAGAGVALLRACLDTLRSGQHQILNTVFMASLAEGLLALGELQAAQQTIDQAAAAGGGTFSAPEIVRIKNMLAALGVATFG